MNPESPQPAAQPPGSWDPVIDGYPRYSVRAFQPYEPNIPREPWTATERDRPSRQQEAWDGVTLPGSRGAESGT